MQEHDPDINQPFPPEDFEPSPPKPSGPLDKFPPLSALQPVVLSYALIILTTLAYWRHPNGSNLWVSGESIFRDHEYWRLFTALLTHSSIVHLLSNTPLFFIFGWFLRAFYGSLAFPVISLIIGMLSNLATVYFYEPQMRLVGASGMLYGMVALWITLYVRHDTNYSWTLRVFRAVAFSLVVMFPTTFEPTTSYMAHAFGFGLGLAFGIVFGGRIKVIAE